MEGEPRCLATATINRMLRQLRTRCNALAKLVSVQSRSSAAPHNYASSRIQPSNHDLPLVVYPPPDKYSSNVHFSQGYKDSLELIRRVYAVRDAFRNAVARADLCQSSQRVPTLSSLCAIDIGQNMPTWEEHEGAEDSASESGATDFVDQMYEAVPMQSRGWLLSSHSLAIVLNTCPHHPTLINILLDEALASRLEHQVSELLEALLLVALRPKPNGPAAICHSGHSKFLNDLLGRCLSAGFSAHSFTKVLLKVLCDVQNTAVWISKAIENLARRLYHLDLTGFIWFVAELAAHTSSRSHLSSPQTLDDTPALSKHLCQWLDILLERFYLSTQARKYHDALFNLVNTSNPRQISGSEVHMLILKDYAISVALVWLTCHRSTAPSTYLEAIEATLASFTPRPATFNPLVRHIFSITPLADARQRLKSYISGLRRLNLIRLEASFWGSTLYVVENLENDSRLTADDRIAFKTYRQEVMDRVDEAESQLFNIPAHITRDLDASGAGGEKQLLSVGQSPWSKGRWKWEPLIGCWVRRQTPESSTPSAAMDRKKRRIALVTPKRTSGRPQGNIPNATPTKFQYERREPSADFVSLVANAVSQRTVLHPVYLNGSRQSSGYEEKSRKICEAPSDDVLDLLA